MPGTVPHGSLPHRVAGVRTIDADRVASRRLAQGSAGATKIDRGDRRDVAPQDIRVGGFEQLRLGNLKNFALKESFSADLLREILRGLSR